MFDNYNFTELNLQLIFFNILILKKKKKHHGGFGKE